MMFLLGAIIASLFWAYFTIKPLQERVNAGIKSLFKGKDKTK